MVMLKSRRHQYRDRIEVNQALLGEMWHVHVLGGCAGEV
jgi:hypothetical protein